MAGDYKASGPMLDSRRDCRYRRGAHRSIGVGLRIFDVHGMPGIFSGPLALLSPLFTRVRGWPISRSILPLYCRRVPPAPVRSWGCAEQTVTTRLLESALHAALAGIHRRFIARCDSGGCPTVALQSRVRSYTAAGFISQTVQRRHWRKLLVSSPF
jgi:hypothetical protein